MKIKSIVIFLVILLILNLATLGTILYYQFYPHHKRTYSPDWQRYKKGHGLPAKLILTPDQRTKFRQLQKKLRGEIQPLMKENWEIRQEVLDLLQQEPVPWEEIQSRQKRLSEIRSQIEMKTMRNIQEAKEFLTPAQQKALFKLLVLPHQRWRGFKMWKYKENPTFKKNKPFKKEDKQ